LRGDGLGGGERMKGEGKRSGGSDVLKQAGRQQLQLELLRAELAFDSIAPASSLLLTSSHMRLLLPHNLLAASPCCLRQFKEITNRSDRANRPAHTSTVNQPVEQSCTDTRAVQSNTSLLHVGPLFHIPRTIIDNVDAHLMSAKQASHASRIGCFLHSA
jgi:hypothetical protein